MIEEKILLQILKYYISASYEYVVKNIISKEKVGKVNNLQILIYSNDHNPPHFHVTSKDKSINAKFKIEDGEYINGKIGIKDLKEFRHFIEI